MRGLHSISYILPISLPHLTYDLATQGDHRSSIGSIRSLLGSSYVHLEGPVNAAEERGRCLEDVSVSVGEGVSVSVGEGVSVSVSVGEGECRY